MLPFTDVIHLNRHGDKLSIRGVSEAEMEIVTENERVIVCKRPGYVWNNCGIRGMPDRRRAPAEMRVFEIISKDSSGIKVKELISWPLRGKSKDK